MTTTTLTVYVDLPVETEHLVLRPATLDDLDATWAIRRLDAVSRWLTPATDDLQEYRQQMNHLVRAELLKLRTTPTLCAVTGREHLD